MTTPDPDAVVGFDPAGDGDTFLVVAYRGADGSWRVDSVDGPAPADVADQIAGWTREPHPAASTPLGPQVADWIQRHARRGEPVTLTAEQREVVDRAYATEPGGGPAGVTAGGRITPASSSMMCSGARSRSPSGCAGLGAIGDHGKPNTGETDTTARELPRISRSWVYPAGKVTKRRQREPPARRRPEMVA